MDSLEPEIKLEPKEEPINDGKFKVISTFKD